LTTESPNGSPSRRRKVIEKKKVAPTSIPIFDPEKFLKWITISAMFLIIIGICTIIFSQLKEQKAFGGALTTIGLLGVIGSYFRKESIIQLYSKSLWLFLLAIPWHFYIIFSAAYLTGKNCHYDCESFYRRTLNIGLLSLAVDFFVIIPTIAKTYSDSEVKLIHKPPLPL